MDNGREPPPSTLEEVLGRLGCLEARVARLEERAAAGGARALVPDEPAPVLPLAGFPLASLALAGRTLLVLAGAYLVRAATDSGVVAPAAGIALGLAYAAFWQLRADREAEAGRTLSATFHDLATSVIAFTLLFEACVRFRLLGAEAAQALLVGFFGLGLGVAWRRRLAPNAVLTTLFALGTAVALLFGSRELLPGLAALVAIAAVVEALSLGAGAFALPACLRWAAALVVDGVAALVIAIGTRPSLPEHAARLSPLPAAAILLAVAVLYLAGVAGRTLHRRRPLTVYDAVQGALAVVLGAAGAWRVCAVHGLPVAFPAAAAVLLGALCYGAAFSLAERLPGQGASFLFHSTAGLVLVVSGSGALGSADAASLAWIALGLLAAVSGRICDRTTLRVHGAICLGAAAVRTGLLFSCAGALGGSATAGLPAPAWLAALAAGTGWLVLAGDPRAPRSGPRRLPQLVLALVAVFGLGKALQLAVFGLAGAPLAADAGRAAVVRTALLGALALGLARLARRRSWPELDWLVYALVAFGGLRLLTQDLPAGRPATLVVSFALYGVVLMLAPRLLKRREPLA